MQRSRGMSGIALTHAPPAPGTLLGLAADVAGWDLRPWAEMVECALGEADWCEFLRIVSGHRLTGFLLDAADAGAFALTRTQHEELSYVHGCLIQHVLQLESALVEVVHELTELGIAHRVLKGAALAHSIYPNPTARLYADIDVLVPSGDLNAAIDGLTRTGATRARIEPRAGFTSRFGKSVDLTRPDGVCIDLHRALAPGAWAVLMDPDALFLTKIDITLALSGATIHGLGPADRFVHACYHATVGSKQLLLLPLRDVVQTALAPDLDERAALDLATAWGASAVVAVAVRLAWDALRPATHSTILDWADTHPPNQRDQRQLGKVRGESTREMLRAIPGLRHKLAYAGALLFPSPAYLAERGQSRVGRLRRGIEQLRRAVTSHQAPPPAGIEPATLRLA